MARQTRSKKIDFTRWTNNNNSANAFGAGTVASTFFASSTTVAQTILRTRGNLVAYADGAPVSGALAIISLGLCLVPEGTGTTVLWSPFTDAEAPWFWHTTFHLGYEEMVTDVIDASGLTVFREMIDSKAMRVLRPDTEVQFVAENTTVLGALTVNVSVGIRMLLGT